jgi:hypothetical protein
MQSALQEGELDFQKLYMLPRTITSPLFVAYGHFELLPSTQTSKQPASTHHSSSQMLRADTLLNLQHILNATYVYRWGSRGAVRSPQPVP